MPRTPRSREEIENKAYFIIDDEPNATEMTAQLVGLSLEVLLDIRDAVMEGKLTNSDK